MHLREGVLPWAIILASPRDIGRMLDGADEASLDDEEDPRDPLGLHRL